MLIQIYEITSPEEAAALSAMGVDHVGVLVGDGSFPREQWPARACEIFAGVHSGAKRCALSLSGDLDQISRIVTAVQPDILHLGAAPELLSPTDVKALKGLFPALTVMRSIPVTDESSIALAHVYEGIADMLLLDSYDPGDRQIGALGIPHSWELDRRVVQSVRIPAIVAGGLGPDNVAAAIAASHPAGVDSKTRTDRADGSHIKDLTKVQAFVRAARAAFAPR
ncbi:MAG TPA: phosphoribosylanthranilate isomerase [Rhizomicrobium sp.]|jgi:phosphoribosylanthranilate isomerase|nr:phosphoribosylanthranilate isomerase [Rhizomicrobium sp.]